MVGKKLAQKILSFLLTINFLIVPNYLNFALAIDIKESESLRRELQSEGEILRKTLSETKGKIEKKNEYIKTVSSQITNVNKQIRITNDRIVSLSNEIVTKQNKIISSQKAIDDNLDILVKRIRAVYVAGDVNALDIVLGAKDYNDFIDKMEIVSRMSMHDEKLVKELNNQIETLNDDKKNIEQNKEKVTSEKHLLSEKQTELNGLQAENEKALEELNVKKEEAQSCIDENDAEFKRIQAQISKYYAEQAKKKVSGKLSKYNVTPSGKNLVWPVPGFTRLSSLFNEKRGEKYHKGIDIAGAGIHGQAAVSADNGVVMLTYNGCTHDYGKLGSCGCGGGYGNYVFIDHGNGKCTVYAHLSDVLVHQGQVVKRGETIGLVGSTGHSTGFHLHFECRLFNQKYDPMSEYR
ncbi:MAG: hypothetical protein RUMPE_00377 [Eubacteriales bacterium SKADARSKE-1]|nr:hypothetical protein [Eubacteriales bacterium SKADARSKE-1]